MQNQINDCLKQKLQSVQILQKYQITQIIGQSKMKKLQRKISLDKTIQEGLLDIISELMCQIQIIQKRNERLQKRSRSNFANEQSQYQNTKYSVQSLKIMVQKMIVTINDTQIIRQTLGNKNVNFRQQQIQRKKQERLKLWQTIQNQKENVDQLKLNLEKQILSKKEQFNKMENLIIDLRKQNTNLERKLKDFQQRQQRFSGQQSKINDLKRQKKNLEKRLNELNIRAGDYLGKYVDSTTQIKKLKKKLNKFEQRQRQEQGQRSQIISLRKQNQNLQQKLNKFEQRQRQEQGQRDQIINLRKQQKKANLESEIFELQNRIKILEQHPQQFLRIKNQDESQIMQKQEYKQRLIASSIKKSNQKMGRKKQSSKSIMIQRFQNSLSKEKAIPSKNDSKKSQLLPKNFNNINFSTLQLRICEEIQKIANEQISAEFFNYLLVKLNKLLGNFKMNVHYVLVRCQICKDRISQALIRFQKELVIYRKK